MKRRVLLCVLDWGLGHATRCLAVIDELEANQVEVVIASSGEALALLKLERPELSFYELPAYGVTYNKSSFEWGIVLQSRKFLKAIRLEHDVVEEILRKEKIDFIISDNRYGCYHESVTSIFLSHHLKIILSGAWELMSSIVNGIHIRMIQKFDDVWVPDYPDRQLGGDLSSVNIPNLRFIGPLSTMQRSAPVTKRNLIAVLSGPEPERTRFSQMIYNQLTSANISFLQIEGKPGATVRSEPNRINFLKRNDLAQSITESSIVICRSGYSSIMDMAVLGCKCIFVPTPGQTEQLYLAQRMQEMGVALFQHQESFNLARALETTAQYSGFDTLKRDGTGLLTKAIVNMIAHE
jgi:UDP:flavonoid glycosyltransferase YjiC (YdhE family)